MCSCNNGGVGLRPAPKPSHPGLQPAPVPPPSTPAPPSTVPIPLMGKPHTVVAEAQPMPTEAGASFWLGEHSIDIDCYREDDGSIVCEVTDCNPVGCRTRELRVGAAFAG